MSNSVDRYGNTLLILACAQEDYPLVLQLIQSGIDVNQANIFRVTPLHEAVRYAYKNSPDASTIVSLLLAEGANINAQTDNGETALIGATYYSYKGTVKTLLENGADVNLRRSDGDTVLSSMERTPSAAKRRKIIIKMLEKAGGVR